ncbi:sialomucin core protein 24-like [Melanotaenia boesemani]|uniref:sialomucin core protein 24-like n=1 Tax=Melanotaenia boesemani TaxID=1250792 RepID=UPI001C03FEB9|nr:sialomucin core protein 24-like [Melanotaenia boesemani]
MDTIFTPLACCLLVLFLPATQMENQNLTTTTPSPGLNLSLDTTVSATSNSDVPVTVFSNSTEHITQDTSTKVDDGKSNTTATTKSTSQHQTSQAATSLATLTNTTLKTTQSTPTPAFTTLTTHAIHTTSYISTPDWSRTTENPPYSFSTITESVHRTTHSVHLNVPEKSMTIIFSAVLALFVVALLIIMLHRCKHKIQYLHQPLNDTEDTGGFMADEDTLVISGGLYDGHPIYDNVPPVPADQSQFRLEFLH